MKIFRNNITRIIPIIVTFLCIGGMISMSAHAQKLQQAPRNPEFVRYLEDLKAGRQLPFPGEENLGDVPPPVDLPPMAGEQVTFDDQTMIEKLPTSYDLRTRNKVTPVKDQGNCGSCWAFATYGSLESNHKPVETKDFSENNLKNTHGFDFGHCSGGNEYMSVAYLGRWSGPVLESQDPYNPNNPTSPKGLKPNKHVQKVFFLPARKSFTDNNNIKNALVSYGAVKISMYWNSSYYKPATAAYYYNGSASTNHAVTIVGWNDRYARSNFQSRPAGNGAFLIKNSWGTGWGQSGYFWISYYDKSLARAVVFVKAEATTNYSRSYQWDPLGWGSSLGYGSTTAWFGNVFTAASGAQTLRAVSFYAASPKSTYVLQIHKSPNNGPINTGGPAFTQSGTLPTAGYHTIMLKSPVPISSRQRFSAVVKLTTPGWNYPVPIEEKYAGYSSKATGAAKQSYISTNGTKWTDLWATYKNYGWMNACLKVFSK